MDFNEISLSARKVGACLSITLSIWSCSRASLGRQERQHWGVLSSIWPQSDHILINGILPCPKPPTLHCCDALSTQCALWPTKPYILIIKGWVKWENNTLHHLFFFMNFSTFIFIFCLVRWGCFKKRGKEVIPHTRKSGRNQIHAKDKLLL